MYAVSAQFPPTLTFLQEISNWKKASISVVLKYSVNKVNHKRNGTEGGGGGHSNKKN
jgi:hypothetical protein